MPVGVELTNRSITLNPSEVAPGDVVFRIENQSSDLVHEVEVFAGGVAGEVLEVRNSIAETSKLTLIDEVENLVPGATASLSVSLESGTYLVICNLPGHYANGMWAYLTVAGS